MKTIAFFMSEADFLNPSGQFEKKLPIAPGLYHMTATIALSAFSPGVADTSTTIVNGSLAPNLGYGIGLIISVPAYGSPLLPGMGVQTFSGPVEVLGEFVLSFASSNTYTGTYYTQVVLSYSPIGEKF